MDKSENRKISKMDRWVDRYLDILERREKCEDEKEWNN